MERWTTSNTCSNGREVKVLMSKTTAWQRGQFLAIGQEYTLPNDAAIMLIKRGVARPVGIVPEWAQRILAGATQTRRKKR